RRADRARTRQAMLPAPGEFVHVGPAVQDAAVLRVAECGADRETARQRLIERRVGSRRRAEHIGREDVRRMRGTVAASEVEPFITARRGAAKYAEPAGVKRDPEVRHRHVLMKLAVRRVGRESGW